MASQVGRDGGSRISRIEQILQQEGISRDFLCPLPISRAVHDGIAGIELQVRLTSYRSLPLSCVASVALRIDGRPIETTAATLELNGVRHGLADFAALHKTWWFILDVATLFVPTDIALAAGPHDIEATIETIEPYITAGRLSFFNPSHRPLPIEGVAP